MISQTHSSLLEDENIIFSYLVLNDVLARVKDTALESRSQGVHGISSDMSEEGKRSEDGLVDLIEILQFELIGDVLHKMLPLLKLKQLMQILLKLYITMNLLLKEGINGSLFIHPMKNSQLLLSQLIRFSYLHDNGSNQVDIVNQHHRRHKLQDGNDNSLMLIGRCVISKTSGGDHRCRPVNSPRVDHIPTLVLKMMCDDPIVREVELADAY